MTWSIVKKDTLHVTIRIGDLEYIVHKSNVTIDPYDTETVLVTIELFKYAKFQVSPITKYPICYAVNFKECVNPVAATRDDLIIALNSLLVEGIKVAKNGTLVSEQPEINFIEGANITITAVDDPTNNKVDVTIASAGGGGGGGTVTSVSASVPSPANPALSVSVTNPTTTPAIAISALGAITQYIRGDGSLQTFPTIPSVTPSALTKIDDTNVTLTLTGSPSTALLAATGITVGWTGTLGISRGGTGVGSAPSNGQILVGNGTGYTLSTISAGTGISITNGAGTITINNTGVVDDPFPKVLMMMGG